MTRHERDHITNLTQRLWNTVWLLLDTEPLLTSETNGKAAQAAVDVVRAALEAKYAEEVA